MVTLFFFLSLVLVVISGKYWLTKSASYLPKSTRLLLFIFSLTLFNSFGSSVLSQTRSVTYKAGVNAGAPSTQRAPITEIVDFKGYNEASATSAAGQSFEIALISGHKLRFTLKKTGVPFIASQAPTYRNASMGAVPSYVSPEGVLPALYSSVNLGPSGATFIFSNIQVFKEDGGTLASSWNIIVIDAESTNVNAEDITNITNGEVWTSWDLITNTAINNPDESGIGTSVVKWTGTNAGITGAYAAATVNPSSITSVLKGSKQGIALAIQTYIGDKVPEACSGSAFNATPVEIIPATEMTYTWSEPIITGDKNAESLTGASAQTTPLPNITQTLFNNTNSKATATYIITPHHQSGTVLATFTLTATINPLPVATISYPGPYCSAGAGTAPVILDGQSGGSFSSTEGLNIDPVTGSINLQTSTPGKYIVTYTFKSDQCENKTTAEIILDDLPTVKATASAINVCAGTPITLAGEGSALTYAWDKGVSDGIAFIPTETSTYTLTGTGAGGCTTTDTVTVMVEPMPTVKATASAMNVCAGKPVTLTAGGTALTYTWDKGVSDGVAFIPTETSTYTLTGIGAGGCITTAVVTVTVNPIPTVKATASAINVCAGTPITLAGEGSALTYVWDKGVSDGITFIPTETSTYTLTGTGAGGCTTTDTVTVTVEPMPTVKATASAMNVCAGKPVTLTAGGTALTYTWDKGVNDGVAFIPLETSTYTLTGTGAGGCTTTHTVTVTVNLCPPVATDDEFTGPEDAPLTGTVITNDSEDTEQDLIFTELAPPDNGSLTFNPDGSFTFLPNPGWNGSTAFEYQVCNAKGLCDTAQATINIQPVNDPPVARNDAYIITESSTLTIAAPGILINDSDPDKDSLSAIRLTAPKNGIATLNADGSFIYTPKSGFSGADSFTYKVSDGELASNIATITITVTGVDNLPVAVDDHFNIPAGKQFPGKVSLNDFHPDSASLTFSIVSQPAHGILVLKPDGDFTYTPDFGYFGDDEFFYKICDPSGACDEAKVTLTIQPAAVVKLTPSLSTIAEGNKVKITAELSQPLNEEVEITLEYTGDALKGQDYRLFENYITIKIPAGQTTTAEFFQVSALIDNLNEKEEHVIVRITYVSSSNVKIGTGADLAILDIYPPYKDVSEQVNNPAIKPDPLMSPNDDRQGNDYFAIGNITLYPDNLVLIFNRWGNEVYRMNGYNNSDRSFRGIANTGMLANRRQDLPEGVYYYIIYTPVAGNTTSLNKGYLILKR